MSAEAKQVALLDHLPGSPPRAPWSLACYRIADYEKSGLPMLPVTHGIGSPCQHILLYTTSRWCRQREPDPGIAGRAAASIWRRSLAAAPPSAGIACAAGLRPLDQTVQRRAGQAYLPLFDRTVRRCLAAALFRRPPDTLTRPRPAAVACSGCGATVRRSPAAACRGCRRNRRCSSPAHEFARPG